MVGQTQRPWVRQNPTSCLTQCQTEKKSFRLCVIFTKNSMVHDLAWRKCSSFSLYPPNEELEGTLHPQKFGCTPKDEGKRVHVPPDEKNLWACWTCGRYMIFSEYSWFPPPIKLTITI